MAGPEDEFQDELNDDNAAAASGEASPSDSSVDLAPDVAMQGQLDDDEDEYAPDDEAPRADLSNELAADAGDQASYGFEAARETVRFEAKPGEVDPDLAEATPDESDRFRPVESPDEPAPQFAEELSPSDSYRVEDDPAASTSELKYTDDPAHLDEPAAEEPADPSTADSGVHLVEAAAPVEDEVEAEPEPEPAPPPRPKSTRAERPPLPRPSTAATAAASATSSEDKPGAVRRSAIDEMFARAAELKRRKSP